MDKLVKWIGIMFIMLTILGISRFLTIQIPLLFIWFAQFWFLTLISIFIYKNRKYFKKLETDTKFLKYYLVYVVIQSCVGFYIQDNYWELKALINHLLGLMIPICVFPFMLPSLLQKVLQKWTKYIFPLFILCLPFLEIWGYGWYWGTLVFFLILFPVFSRKQKIAILIFSFLIATSDLEGRSIVLKFGLAFFISCLYYLRIFLTPKLLSILLYTTFIIPFFLFYLGVSGTFNVFKIEEFLEEKKYITSANKPTTALVDTRSFIYEEQILSAIKNNYWIWGRTPARGFDSVYGEQNIELIKNAGNTKDNKGKNLKDERMGCEVSILNIFNWLGIIGVILYTLLFYKAISLAFKARNIYIILIGIYLLFRYCYSWAEDMIQPDAPYITLYLLIAMCYSPFFRAMNNKEFKLWTKEILNKTTKRI